MSWPGILEFSAAFLLAFFISSLAEYIVHRLMHAGYIDAKNHADHHKEGGAQGWFLEFKAYIVPAMPAIVGVSALLWFLEFPVAAISFAAGVVIYEILAAYAHQLQHDNPDLCFWLPQPVHFTHHKDKMWHHNFGILVDFWDRIFGTYKSIDYLPEKKFYQYPLSAFFKINWL
jgi:sterol desaturase/sphingolipid hydroxylase (fatty acid hydroxylase superfamily)